MKKYYSLAAAALVLLVSCNKQEPAPVESSITLDPASLTIPAEGGSKSIIVTSSEDWSIRDYKECDWCEVSATSGKTGDEVRFSVATATYEAREISFVFVSGKAEATLKISQDVTDRSIKLSPASAHFSCEAGSSDFTVECSDNWTVENYDSSAWYSLSTQSGANGDKVTVTVQEAQYEDRSATIVFACGKAKAEFTITQESKEQSISIDPVSLDFPAEGGVKTVAVTSTSDWKAEESIEWLWVEKDNDGNALVNVTPSDTPAVQEGTVVFKCGDKTAELSVSLAGCAVIEFADKMFESIVLGIEDADSNNDGFITAAEAAAIQCIDCRNRGDIATIEDIKHFPALREFYITDNIITEADFTANKDLEVVITQNNNRLERVDVSNLEKLRLFDTQGSGNVESVNVKGCTALRQLGINNLTKLTGIDLSDCTSLQQLYFQNNEKLESLDLSNCVNLEVLQLNYAPKFQGDLDLSKCTNLREVIISDFWNSAVILGEMPNLQQIVLNVNNSKIESLDFSASPELRRLEIIRNYGLKNVNLTGCTKLESFTCFDTAITELDLSTNNKLNDFRPGSPDQEPRYLNLVKLTLSRSNSLPATKLEEIQKYCPDIEIVYVD
ncbi:MAG: BACON domain-containing protein [Candidatus Cryptobacteroides sp.]